MDSHKKKGYVSLDYIYVIGIFLTLLILYAFTASSAVLLEDDGFFILSCQSWGVAHPPGYPLYVSLGKIFSMLPIGTEAYRIHIMSGIFGAGACIFIYLIVNQILRSRKIALFSALLLGLSELFWSQALISDVYTLNCLLFFGGMYYVLRFSYRLNDKKSKGITIIFGVICGLGLSNHWPLFVLSSVGICVSLLPYWKGVVRKMPWAFIGLAFGLIPYGLMVYRSQQPEVFSFLGSIESWGDFWRIVLRVDFQAVDNSVTSSLVDKLQYFAYVTKVLLGQFTYLGGGMVMLGAFIGSRKVSKFLLLGMLTTIFMVTYFLIIRLNFDFDYLYKNVFRVYMLPALGMMAILFGLGWDYIFTHERLPVRLKSSNIQTLIFSVLAIILGAWSYFDNNYAGYDWSEFYAESILKVMPKDSVILIDGDVNTGTIGYKHFSGGLREDLTIYHPRGDLLPTRIFDPKRLTPNEKLNFWIENLFREKRPLIFIGAKIYDKYPHYDHWIFHQLNSNNFSEKLVLPKLEPELMSVADRIVFDPEQHDPWTIMHQRLLKRRLGIWVGRHKNLIPENLRPKVEVWSSELKKDYYGSLGLVRGLMLDPDYKNVKLAKQIISGAINMIDMEAPKKYESELFELKGRIYLYENKRNNAKEMMRESLNAWPNKMNRSLELLFKIAIMEKDSAAYESLKNRWYPEQRLPESIERFKQKLKN